MKYFVEHLPARSEKAVTDWGPGLEPAAQRSPNKRSKLSLYKKPFIAEAAKDINLCRS